jgi:hypothetical protein
MAIRKLLLPLALAGAVGVPYAWDKGWTKPAVDKVRGILASRTDGPVPPGARYDQFASEYTFGPRAETPRADAEAFVAGPAVANLGEILRFDVTPTWVTGRWPRVTTTLAESGLSGLRVPLVTGIATDDLAGTITYYFDRNHQVQRLAFDGYTGDARKLLDLLTRFYGLQPEPTLDAALYVARWNGAPTSVVRIARAPVMTADSPHSQLRVMLELNRPSVYYGLSPQFQQLVQATQATRRW